jgi:hypothetical protein
LMSPPPEISESASIEISEKSFVVFFIASPLCNGGAAAKCA